MSDDLSPATTRQPANRGRRPARKQLAPGATPRQEAGEFRADATGESPAAKEDRWRETDEKLDQALKGTFPASDPFSLW